MWIAFFIPLYIVLAIIVIGVLYWSGVYKREPEEIGVCIFIGLVFPCSLIAYCIYCVVMFPIWVVKRHSKRRKKL